MSFTVGCSCGMIYTLPDNATTSHVRCTGCGASIPVAGRAARAAPRSFPVVGIAIAGAVLAVAAIGALVVLYQQTRREKPYVPAAPETSEEKYHSAAEVYAGGTGAKLDPAGDEGEITKLLVEFAAAQRSGDGERYADCINYRRMLAQLEASGMKFPIRTKKDENDFVRGLRIGMVKAAPQIVAIEVLQWEKIRVIAIRFQREKGEAEAFCRLTLGSNVCGKFRFWLIKEEGKWKAFDWESLDEGLRTSDAMVAATAGSSDAAAAGLQRAVAFRNEGVTKLQAGELEAALEKFRGARAFAPPAMILSQLDLLEGSTLSAMGKSDEALKMLDQALARQKDLPVAHHIKAQIYSAIGKHEECIREEEEYIRMLGEDTDALLSIAASWKALKKPEEEIKAYRRAIGADDEDSRARVELAFLLFDRKEDGEAGNLLAEACLKAPEEENLYGSLVFRLQLAKEYETLLSLSKKQAGRFPDDAGIRYHQGQALYALTRYGEAETAYRAGLERAAQEEHPDYWEQLAYALARQGKAEEALAFADRRVEVDAKDGTGHYARAFVHALSKKEDEAEASLKRALELTPDCAYYVESEPAFESLRDRPGVKEMLEAAKKRAEEAEDEE